MDIHSPESRTIRLPADWARDDDGRTPAPWKRRRPTWPYLAVLCALFAFTIAAPKLWQQRHGTGSRSHAEFGRWDDEQPIGDDDAPQHDEPSTPEVAAVDAAPALPPLAALEPLITEPTFAAPELAEPAPVGPTVASDDYLAVDEPLVEPAPEAVLPTPNSMENGDAALSAVAESFAQRPGGRSVVVRSVPAPEAPSRRAVSVESLVKARDALVAWLEQARTLAPPLPTRPTPLRVMVDSENDRLAMVPDLAEPTPMGSPADAATPYPSLTPELAMVPEPAPQAAPAPVRQPEPAAPALKHRPIALLAQLEALQGDSAGSAWAREVLNQLEPMILEPAPANRSWQPTLDELHRLSAQGVADSMGVADPADQSAWMRAARALDRRLPIWQLLLDPYAAKLVEGRTASNEASLLQSIHEAAALTAGADGAGWRSYLRLDDLAGLTSVGGDDYAEARRAAARDVLMRMADPLLTAEQLQFLAQPPMAALRRDLRPWAAGVISLDALNALVERYEAEGLEGDASTIAELWTRMKWSEDERLTALADHLNRNYRNGNVRFALSADFLNRMIPPQEPKVAPVRDNIAGTDVRGQSRTHTEVHLRMLPDPTVWRFGLEVQGDVHSQTYSDVGAARVRNASRMQYEARKLIVVNRFGMHVWPAEAKVQGRNSLVGVDSHLGPVPLVGPIVDEMIRETHRNNVGAAMAEAKSKVKRKACSQMNREADAKLTALQDRCRTELLGALDRLALVAEPLEMSTTEERAVMRLRLAGEPQLGAHTPRPSAPSDSLVSVQFHESAMNNALEGLGLDGQRMTVGELHSLLGTKFTRLASAPPDDLPTRAIVEFARHDAVRVRCQADCIELVLGIKELRKGRDSIRNVTVHAFFRPVIQGLEVKLVRDGTLQFEGAHLRTGPRLVLHSVFGKLLRKDQEAPIIGSRLGDDPRFADVMVTQFVIDDGWVALSLGPASPERVAWRTRTTK